MELSELKKALDFYEEVYADRVISRAVRLKERTTKKVLELAEMGIDPKENPEKYALAICAICAEEADR